MTTTAGTTSRGYRYPGDASATDVPGDLKKLADDVNTDVAAVAADGAVTTAKIAASAVTSAKIADATIVTGDLADSAVTSAKIADGTIATGDLADSAVTSAKIAAGTIVSSDLATSAVATSNIADSAVTSAKIADGTIATADLADGAVTSAKIADGTIATGDLADSAVTSAKIADGTIVNADVNASAAIDVAKLSGVVASATVGNLLASAAANCTGGLSLYKYTAAYGSESVTVTATDTVAGWVYNTGTVSVTAGKTYTFRVDVTASSGRDWRLSVQWRTGGSSVGGLVSSQVLGVGATGTLSQSIVAPAGADNVYCNIYSGSGSIGDTATFSKFGIWEGAGGIWSLPGTGIKGTYDTLSVVPRSDVGNILPANVATGTGTLSDVSGFYATSNYTLTSDTAQAYQGSRALKMVATGTGSPYVTHGGTVINGTIPVTPGVPYTLSVWAMSTTITRSFAARVYWYQSNGTQISNVSGTYAALSSSWQRYAVTAVAPANAAYASVMFIGTSVAVGETLWTDAWGFWQGAGGLWAPPGTPIANLGTYTDETVGRRIFTWDTANNRWQMTYGDTGWREINALQTAAALTKFPNAVLSVRRVNSSVDVRWFSDTGTVAGAAGTAICSTLTGFRPGVIQGRGVVGSAVNASSGLPSVHGVYSDGAALNIATTADSANNVLASLSYTTNDSWPAALPGNAIGSIPQ